MSKENAKAHMNAKKGKKFVIGGGYLNPKNRAGLVGEKNSSDVHKGIDVKENKTLTVDKNKQEGFDKTRKNNNVSVFVILALVLAGVMVFGYYLFFQNLEFYKFSFNINGVDFVSNDYTPSIFFPEFKKNSEFYVSIDLKKGEDNQWLVNSLNLWIIALNYDKKKVITLIKEVDDSGIALLCMTNDGNVLSARKLPLAECENILSDENNPIVRIKLGNKDKAILSKNKVEVIASGNKTISHVNYYVIKEMYPNIDTIIAIVNERISGIN